jgi:hypothetical protein
LAVPNVEQSFAERERLSTKDIRNKGSIDFNPRFRKAALLETDSVRLAQAGGGYCGAFC